MKRIILICLILILVLGMLILVLGYRQQIMDGESFAFLTGPAVAAVPANAAATPLATAHLATPMPTPPPIEEDPAQNVRLAWEALFTYTAHEAPVRVLALLTNEGSPGDVLFQNMLQEGKLMNRGAFYSDSGEGPKAWVAEALLGVPVGLLDSIYAETPALAMAAYEALREAGRNDSVEVISAGITEEVIFAMQEDHFAMGAAAGIYENELRVVYSWEFMGK